MNFSSPGQNGSLESNRDSYTSAVTKNVIVVTLGLTINYINGMLIHTFRKNQMFYTTPRYILFIHLVVNDMIQLTSAIILYISSYVFYKINASICCIFLCFALYTTLNSPINLAVMAVECYIAICYPLRHAEFCTVKTTYILIACIWVMSSIGILPDLFLLIATEPVEYFLTKLFCERENFFRHPASSKKREVLYTLYLVVIWIALLYTYLQIFIAAKAANALNGDPKKAKNTILLHAFQLLLCILTYVFHFVVSLLVSLFPRNSIHVIFASYIFIQILPRLVSPIVYGLRDQMFRQSLKKHLLCAIRSKP
ncbi:odorant receptor 131-2-like [Periophthalmus magnuspinnatus]|uniref:odorant receptor 131-2-like n=1 Tax=Periophthalmus magnuspinnatus TaxID=409849 RepID=UPI00145AC854|nr:odorant receptor 131-2-like [Periophthalmus magnuspinnatus]